MDSEFVHDLGIFSDDAELFVKVVLALPRHRIVPADALDLDEEEKVRALLQDEAGVKLAVIVSDNDMPNHLRSEGEVAKAREHATGALERHSAIAAETDRIIESTSEEVEEAHARKQRAEHDLHQAQLRHDTAKREREKADVQLRLALDDSTIFG